MLTRIFYHQMRHIYHHSKMECNGGRRHEKENVAWHFCVYSVFTFKNHFDEFLHCDFFSLKQAQKKNEQKSSHRTCLPDGKCTYFWYVRNAMHLHIFRPLFLHLSNVVVAAAAWSFIEAFTCNFQSVGSKMKPFICTPSFLHLTSTSVRSCHRGFFQLTNLHTHTHTYHMRVQTI